MDYGKFIGILRNVPVDASAERRIWEKISRALQKKDVGVFSLAGLWPKFLVPAAAFAVILIIYLYGHAKQIETRAFARQIYSTEYIYETCKYDGFWN